MNHPLTKSLGLELEYLSDGVSPVKDWYVSADDLEEALAHRDSQVQGLVDALKFYANRNTWGMSCGDEVSQHYDVIPGKDTCSGGGRRYYGGLRARDALAAFTSGESPDTVAVSREKWEELLKKAKDSESHPFSAAFHMQVIEAIKAIGKDGAAAMGRANHEEEQRKAWIKQGMGW